MEQLPKDLQNIIVDYKYQLEVSEKKERLHRELTEQLEVFTEYIYDGNGDKVDHITEMYFKGNYVEYSTCLDEDDGNKEKLLVREYNVNGDYIEGKKEYVV